MHSRFLWASSLAWLALAGCGMFDGKKVGTELTCDPKDPKCVPCDPVADPGCEETDAGAPLQGAIGKACKTSTQCTGALKLGCVEGKCALLGNLPEGTRCNVTGECDEGLYCAIEADRTCTKAGDATEGTRCEATGECERGLVCTYSGLVRKCVEGGDGDLGDTCSSTSSCLAGLLCPPATPSQPKRVCVPTPQKLPEVAWSGLVCEADNGAARAYFHVPRGDKSDKDFFRLPFPNDVRKKKGRLDLEGFPSPGDLLGVGDLVGNYVKAAERDLDGFATNAVVYFRFSKPYAPASVADKTLLLYNIDPDSAGYGRAISRTWGTTSPDDQITRYVCPNWLNLRTGPGAPLAPNTTYAVILTNGIKPRAGGEAFARDADLDALLNGKAPSDATMAAAHKAYAPLRDFIAEGKVDADDILNAAVFTTQTPTTLISKLRDAVQASQTPSLKNVTVCKKGVKSPCDDGEERACGASDDYVEIHGLIRLPVYQSGEPPYETKGGAIALSTNGTPKVVRSEDVCFGLALPKSAPPAEGYPVAIYGHGTGGSFKSGISDLAATATSVGAAVLTIDLPQHGSRKHGSALGSDELFFNFVNPDAALGNVAQGSADLLSLVKWATVVNQPASSDFGQAVKFDASRIALFGHSQGATHTSLMTPYANDVAGVVLSGLGGDLSEGLISKQSPIDLSVALPVLLGDPEAKPYDVKSCPACVGSNHPVYALLQAFFERVDPVNFGSGLTKLPEDGTAKHVFMTYGLGDTYAPESTQRAYAISAGLPHVGEELSKLYKNGPVPAPQASNVKIGDFSVTQGVSQYKPKSGEDGHFVYLGAGKADWQRFLKALLQGETPEIGQ